MSESTEYTLLERVKGWSSSLFSAKDCLKSLAKDSLYITLYYFFTVMVSTINIHYISLKNDEAMLAGIGLATSWVSATNHTIIFGLNVGTLALCSQALGAGEIKLAGIYFQRALLMRYILFIPCYALLYYANGIFLSWGVEEAVANHATTYCRLQFFPLLCLIVFDTTKSLLIAGGIFMPFFYIQVVMAMTHWLICSISVAFFDLDFMGITVSQTISYIVSLALLYGYVKMKEPCKGSFFWFESFELPPVFAQFTKEVPIGIMYYLQAMGFELTVVIASQYAAAELAAQVILWNYVTYAFLPTLAMNMVLTSAIGNCLGNKDAAKADEYRKAGFMYILMLAAIEIPLSLFFKYQILGIYTQSEEITAVCARGMNIYCVIMIADFIQSTNNCILRGCGQEKLGCILFILTSYIIGTPASYVMGTLFSLYTVGLWLGILMGTYVNIVLSGWAVYKLDFAHQAAIINQRLHNDLQGGVAEDTKKGHYIEMQDIAP